MLRLLLFLFRAVDPRIGRSRIDRYLAGQACRTLAGDGFAAALLLFLAMGLLVVSTSYRAIVLRTTRTPRTRWWGRTGGSTSRHRRTSARDPAHAAEHDPRGAYGTGLESGTFTLAADGAGDRSRDVHHGGMVALGLLRDADRSRSSIVRRSSSARSCRRGLHPRAHARRREEGGGHRIHIDRHRARTETGSPARRRRSVERGTATYEMQLYAGERLLRSRSSRPRWTLPTRLPFEIRSKRPTGRRSRSRDGCR